MCDSCLLWVTSKAQELNFQWGAHEWEHFEVDVSRLVTGSGVCSVCLLHWCWWWSFGRRGRWIFTSTFEHFLFVCFCWVFVLLNFTSSYHCTAMLHPRTVCTMYIYIYIYIYKQLSPTVYFTQKWESKKVWLVIWVNSVLFPLVVRSNLIS